MVRLKACCSDELLKARLYFNSNMVRLKDISTVNNVGAYVEFQFQYGSIKRIKRSEQEHVQM